MFDREHRFCKMKMENWGARLATNSSNASEDRVRQYMLGAKDISADGMLWEGTLIHMAGTVTIETRSLEPQVGGSF